MNKGIQEVAGHDSDIENAIFNKYRELREKNKDICNQCNCSVKIGNDGRPVSFFVVGEDFHKEQHKVVFVGKTVQFGWGERSEPPDPIDNISGFIDARKNAKELLFLPFWSTYPFWQCIKEVCQAFWEISDAEVLWKKIAVTNLVKCSTSKGRDETPDLLKTNCIEDAKFFEEEVKIIQPTHIVLFTGFEYDKYIRNIDFGYRYEDLATNYKDLGENLGKVPWWHRRFWEMDRVKMHSLRTYHPGYLKSQSKQEFFSHNVAEWIRASLVSV